ncbi:MAG: hypothetical protein HY259_12930 [Chloroflexi bacterium]|nr:hypothetical protein [Chloroflexota bacterium]MBI3734340.1 hypothetical protein [Chloroflexota bacterium]
MTQWAYDGDHLGSASLTSDQNQAVVLHLWYYPYVGIRYIFSRGRFKIARVR